VSELAKGSASQVLDEAYEMIAFSGFELPNGFVNHGAMACEALSTLGFDDEVGDWARRFSGIAGPSVEPEVPVSFDWRQALGTYGRLPEWIGFFETAVEDEGWAQVVATWVPRLVPALSTALFHGAIRTAHAVRAIESSDTVPRRRELARALAYWAARFREGENALPVPEVEDVLASVVEAAGEAARFYLGSPSIYYLHGVTGAMAVELLAVHLPPPAAAMALAQVRAEHVALYSGARRVAVPKVESPGALADDTALAEAATASGDPHQVKLVEACRRGWAVSADPAFPAASEVVTGLG
jgi:hypothetical protein